MDEVRLKTKAIELIERNAKNIGKKEAYKEIVRSLESMRKLITRIHGSDTKGLKHIDILIEVYEGKSS